MHSAISLQPEIASSNPESPRSGLRCNRMCSTRAVFYCSSKVALDEAMEFFCMRLLHRLVIYPAQLIEFLCILLNMDCVERPRHFTSTGRRECRWPNSRNANVRRSSWKSDPPRRHRQRYSASEDACRGTKLEAENSCSSAPRFSKPHGVPALRFRRDGSGPEVNCVGIFALQFLLREAVILSGSRI